MDNKRVLLAFILSFAVLIAFRWVFPPAVEQPAPALLLQQQRRFLS
jgi:hypothetical protein